MGSGSQRRMTGEEFTLLASHIWGVRFGGLAAAELGVSRRTVHNYATGERLVSHSVPARMKALVARKMAVLRGVAEELNDVLGLPVNERERVALAHWPVGPEPVADEAGEAAGEDDGPEAEDAV